MILHCKKITFWHFECLFDSYQNEQSDHLKFFHAKEIEIIGLINFLDQKIFFCNQNSGCLAEWPKAPVLKTGPDGAWVRIPQQPLFFSKSALV